MHHEREARCLAVSCVGKRHQHLERTAPVAVFEVFQGFVERADCCCFMPKATAGRAIKRDDVFAVFIESPLIYGRLPRRLMKSVRVMHRAATI